MVTPNTNIPLKYWTKKVKELEKEVFNTEEALVAIKIDLAYKLCVVLNILNVSRKRKAQIL